MKGLTTASAELALAVALGSAWLAAQNPPQEPAAPAAERAKPEAPGPVKSLPATVDPKSFSLGPEDVIFVRVWREPDLSGQNVIRPDGMINMPLIKELQAAGLTPEQLAARITESLSKYINNPQVMVSVLAVRSKKYYVTGEVNRPAAYPLAVPTTVFEAITVAGGFRDFANKKKITIVRGAKRLRFNYNEVVKGKNLSQNVLLENGDQIIVR